MQKSKLMFIKIALLLASLFALTSCGFPPSNETLVEKYTSDPKGYEELAEMIEHDAGKNDYFAVGEDMIGNYWEYQGKWSRSGGAFNKADINISLPEVLTKVGLSSQRYADYMQLFEKTGSERVTFYKGNSTPSPVVNILVFRSGTMMGGWGATISRRKDGITPKDENSWCCSTKNTKIHDGWYLSMQTES